MIVTLGSRSRGWLRRLALGAAAAVLAPGFTTGAALAGGKLDKKFGGGGRVTTPFGAFARANALAALPGGQVVAAGHSASGDFGSGFDYDFALARYNADGSLDATFDGDGQLTTDFGTDGDAAKAVAIQPSDDKIVAAGSAFFDIALARYEADGSLDPTFGTGGKATLRIDSNCQGAAVAIQPLDGKILVAGNAFTGSGNNFALARFGTDGMPDASFGNGGAVSIHFTSLPVEMAYSMVLQEDGRIVLAGQAYSNLDGTLNDFLIARYESDGSPDPTFGSGGFVQVDFNPSSEAAQAVALQRDGKILAAGYTYQNNTGDFALVRLNADGMPDTTFGVGGKQTTDFAAGPGNGDQATAIAIQLGSKPSKDKIILGGSAFIDTTYDFALARYKMNGVLDKKLAGGKLTTEIGPGDTEEGIAALVLQERGRLVAAGGSSPGGSSAFFTLTRYKVR